MTNNIHHQLMITYLTFNKLISEKTLKEGLNPGEPKILEFLFSHEGCKQKDIAENCCLNPASVTGILGRMEKNGFIIRKQIGDNRRALFTFLTPLGNEKATQVLRIFNEIDDCTFNDFSDEDKDILLSLFERMQSNMHNKDKQHVE